MLTDYSSCYELNKTSTPLSAKLKDCQIFYVIRVLGYLNTCSLISKRKKVIFLYFFTHAFLKKWALIILVQRLHNIITKDCIYALFKHLRKCYTCNSAVIWLKYSRYGWKWYIHVSNTHVILKKLPISCYKSIHRHSFHYSQLFTILNEKANNNFHIQCSTSVFQIVWFLHRNYCLDFVIWNSRNRDLC